MHITEGTAPGAGGVDAFAPVSGGSGLRYTAGQKCFEGFRPILYGPRIDRLN